MQHIHVYSQTAALQPMQCYPWSSTASRRSLATLDAGVNHTLVARVPSPINNGPLFPDLLGSLLSCPNIPNTPTGDCLVDISDYGGDPTDGGAISKRDANVKRDVIVQRARKSGQFCKASQNFAGVDAISIRSSTYSSSNALITQGSTNPFNTYGPLNPGNCDDYSTFGTAGPLLCDINRPFADGCLNWATEHVLVSVV